MPRLAALTFAILIVFSGLISRGARATEIGPGTEAVRAANNTIRNLLKEKAAPGSDAEKKLAARVTTSVRAFLDVTELGKRAMVDHFSTLSAAQQKEFSELLRALVEQNYVKGLRANIQYEVSYLGESAKGADRLVVTEIKTKRKGRPFTISIVYLVRKDKNGWRAFDVITDDVSLIENYRAQFNKIIAKEGFAGLIRRMRQKKEQLDR